MRICGLQKLTLLDYPERTACTVFTGGCNFRCPFCHNAALLDPAPGTETVSEESFFAFLEKRKKLLDGVCVSGGEPLLQKDIGDFLAKIKGLGYRVKLDTNGSFPEILEEILRKNLADYVAMDIKNAPEKYGETVGLTHWDWTPVKKSIQILMKGRIPFEFRTTVVREFHTAEDFLSIAASIGGAPRYYLQQFTDQGGNVRAGLHSYMKEELTRFLQSIRPFFKVAELRGI